MRSFRGCHSPDTSVVKYQDKSWPGHVNCGVSRSIKSVVFNDIQYRIDRVTRFSSVVTNGNIPRISGLINSERLSAMPEMTLQHNFADYEKHALNIYYLKSMCYCLIKPFTTFMDRVN